jgi:hypothetical protein
MHGLLNNAIYSTLEYITLLLNGCMNVLLQQSVEATAESLSMVNVLNIKGFSWMQGKS